MSTGPVVTAARAGASTGGPVIARADPSRWWIGAGAALLHLVACLLVFLPDPNAGGDNATYLSLAQALLEGRYVELWDPALPRHGLYPPVFPAILAVAWTAGMRTFATLKLVIVIASAAAVGLSAAWAAGRFGRATGMVAGLALALLPGTLEQSHWVLSDVPFWLFSALTLLALAERERAGPGDGSSRAATAWGGVAVAGALLAYLTRSAGLPLLLAVGIHLTLRRDWRLLGAGAMVLIPAAIAWGIHSAGGGGGGYGEALLALDPYQPHLGTVGVGDMVDRVRDNVARYGGIHLPLFLLGSPAPAAVATTWILLLLALVGWATSPRRSRPDAADLFLPLYAGLLLIWPATWAGERFLLPAVPILLGYAIATTMGWADRSATRWIARRKTPDTQPSRARRNDPGRPGRDPERLRWGGVAAAGVLVTIVLAFPLRDRAREAMACRADVAAGVRLPCTSPPWRDLFLLAEDLRGRLPEGAVVLSRKPSLFFIFSGYRSRLYPKSDDPETFFAEARMAGAEWVLVDQSRDLAHLYLHPVLLAARDQFCVVPDPIREDATLLRIDRDGPARGANAPPNAFRSCPLEGAP